MLVEGEMEEQYSPWVVGKWEEQMLGALVLEEVEELWGVDYSEVGCRSG